MEILAQDFWVPSSSVRSEQPKFLGKEVFTEILTCTEETAYLYAWRVCQDLLFHDFFRTINVVCLDDFMPLQFSIYQKFQIS